MTLDLNFVYYRNFRFDGKFHVRCIGSDLHKVSRIRYELERVDAEGSVSFKGISVQSQARTGRLSDHGCPALLVAEAAAGTYSIRPRVVLLDAYAQATGRPVGAAGVIEMPALVLDIKHPELNRSILDTLPLPSANRRRKRSAGNDAAQGKIVDDPYGEALPVFPEIGPDATYPTLVIKFNDGGLEQFRRDIEPDSNSALVRSWPALKSAIAFWPFLDEHERQNERLQVLSEYCYVQQLDGMPNDAFVTLLKTLAAQPSVQSLHFLAPDAQPNIILAGLAAVAATLITGGAVVAGSNAFEDAQPTPDFQALQHYLDEPDARSQGLNIRKAWQRQVTGKGARIHFSDGGLFADHEELLGNPNLKIVSQHPNHDPKHGTAAVGIILAASNGTGVTGVSHDSELYLYNNRATNAQGHSQTLKDLLQHVEPGDIVGINRQTATVEVLTTFLPSLHDRAWWDVARELSQRGAVVVNAAGNGSNADLTDKGTRKSYGVDLSNWAYFNDHGEADAILVGASHSWNGKPHQYSNYGYRYRMLNAWGDSVATLAYGDLQDRSDDDRDYTSNFAGTSSATPLVTGALSLIQSYAMEQHHVYLNANQMHLLVMASGYEDATLFHTDVLPMGARPNVYGALKRLDQILGEGRFLLGEG
ncbi:Subtilase family protein [compost metagenome]